MRGLLARSQGQANCRADRRRAERGKGLPQSGYRVPQKGDTARAPERYDKSLKITKRIGDQRSSATLYFNLGYLYAQTGDRDQSRRHYEKAKALCEMLGLSRDAQKAARALQTL